MKFLFGIPLRRKVATGLCALCCTPVWAQQQEIAPQRPSAPVFWRPYMPPDVPSVRLANTSRLASLIRGGNLYLSAHDAIALALENNIDIEVARYTPLLLEWQLERSEAGGALPGVPSGASQAVSVASGQGVLGSQQAAGVSTQGGNTVGGGNNTTITQVGPVTQTLDPAIQESNTYSHRSLPQANSTQSVQQVLVQNQRIYTGSYQQGFVEGGSVSVSYNEHYLNENAPTDVLNPSVAPTLGINFQLNLLNGFGRAVGARNITIAKVNLDSSDLAFKSQVSGTIGSVLQNYFSLVADVDDVRSKQNALDTANRFFDETKRRLDLGASAQLDVATAENQAAVARLALINSQTASQQAELQLKNLISRAGTGDPLIAGVHIIPLDHITIPATDDLPPAKDLVTKALANRLDLISERVGIRTSEISSLGTKNGLLPTLQVFGSRNTAGLAGNPQLVSVGRADPRFAGGIGTALSQVFQQDFPSESIGGGVRVPLYNRQAQADYGIDQISSRQQDLGLAKDSNQVQVDVLNAVVAIRQARARSEAAVQSRILQQKLYDAEQKKYEAGESTTYNVIQQLRDLTAAQSSELAALVTWQSARINLDQTTGSLLEVNQVSIGDAKAGKVSAPSVLPATLP